MLFIRDVVPSLNSHYALPSVRAEHWNSAALSRKRVLRHVIYTFTLWKAPPGATTSYCSSIKKKVDVTLTWQTLVTAVVRVSVSVCLSGRQIVTRTRLDVLYPCVSTRSNWSTEEFHYKHCVVYKWISLWGKAADFINKDVIMTLFIRDGKVQGFPVKRYNITSRPTSKNSKLTKWTLWQINDDYPPYIIIIAYKEVSLRAWAFYYFETTGTPGGDYALRLARVMCLRFFRDGER